MTSQNFFKNGNSREKVLILGGSGWFGNEIASLALQNQIQVLAVGSRDSVAQIGNRILPVHKFDLTQISKFEPTVVFDAAFITREKLRSYSNEEYAAVNRNIMSKALTVSRLSTVEKFVGFSSGAAIHKAGFPDFSLENNPYAFLKREYESEIVLNGQRPGLAIVVPRVWSVTGAHCSKPDVFAFTNFIDQARAGHISIEASHRVMRRYAPIHQVISVALEISEKGKARVFDTGGPLIEIGDLAIEIIKYINPNATVERDYRPELPEDDYYSDGREWSQILNNLGRRLASIREQIERVSKNFR